MKRIFLITLFISMAISSLSVFAQDDDEDILDCDAYLEELADQLDSLDARLEWIPLTTSSHRSNYIAWQEDRLEWQAIDPPECAIELHDDVIALYADLGDISMWGLWLEIEPESRSGQRLMRESVERAGSSISSVASQYETLTDDEVDVIDSLEGLELLLERLDSE